MSETQTINLKDLTENIKEIGKAVKDLQSKATPAQVPVALTETTGKPKEDYKVHLLEMLREKNPNSPNSNFKWCPKSYDKTDIAKEDRMFTETIGAASVGSAIPDLWSNELQILQAYPSSAFLGNPAVTWHNDLSGKAGDSVNVITVLQPVAGTAGCAEPAGTAPTISCLNISLTEWQCAMSICRNDLEDMVPETLTAMNESLTRCLDAGIDNHFVGIISPVCAGTVNTGTLAATPANIASAIGSMRTGTENPIIGVMHPAVEAQLMRDSQFVNAATYGDTSVITGGHIVKYLGIDFIVVPCGSLTVGAAPGTAYETYIMAKGAVHGAMKRPASVESQYLVQGQKKYVYASVRYGAAMVNKVGCWKIRTGLGA